MIYDVTQLAPHFHLVPLTLFIPRVTPPLPLSFPCLPFSVPASVPALGT